MSTLLIRNAEILVTMDEARREILDGGLFARDGALVAVAPTADLPRSADHVIDATGCAVTPGLVTPPPHHHLFQTLTRAVPAAQDAALFGWLRALHPIWARMGPEEVRISALAGLAELALSGCSTSADHLYLFPNGARLDDEIDASRAEQAGAWDKVAGLAHVRSAGSAWWSPRAGSRRSTCR